MSTQTQFAFTTGEQLCLLRSYLARAATARIWRDAGETKDAFISNYGSPEFSAAAWDIACGKASKEMRFLMGVIAN